MSKTSYRLIREDNLITGSALYLVQQRIPAPAQSKLLLWLWQTMGYTFDEWITIERVLSTKRDHSEAKEQALRLYNYHAYGTPLQVTEIIAES